MTIEWTVDNEIQLFQAMVGHRPVGINKHFQMLMIHNKLSEGINAEISTQEIWKKLETLYDLGALDETKNTSLKEQATSDFNLPSDYVSNAGTPEPHTPTPSAPHTPTPLRNTAHSRVMADSKEASPRRRRGTPDPEEGGRRPKRPARDSPAPRRRK